MTLKENASCIILTILLNSFCNVNVNIIILLQKEDVLFYQCAFANQNVISSNLYY